MMWTQDAARELVADRLRTLQAAYSPDARPTLPRRSRRQWRLAFRRANAPGRTSLAPATADSNMHAVAARYRCRAWP